MTNTKNPENQNIKKMPVTWPTRLKFTLITLLIIVAVASSIIIIKQNLIRSQLQNARNYVTDFISQKGFELQDIVISGRVRTDLAEITRVLDLKRGDNFFNINLDEVKQKLEDLPWVRDITVKRTFLPNILQINIKEKEVMAIWQLNKRFYPLDMDGYVIEAEYNTAKPILLVVGEEAPEHIKELMQTIKQIDKSYVNRVKAATYVSKRRWNIIFDDINAGITVKLPEDNYAAAITKLINLDKTTSILKRKLTIIDLRLPNKVTVKMRKGLTKLHTKSKAL